MTRSVTIRGAVSDGSDARRIERLAALAGSHPPEGAVLLAEIEGDPVAAIGIFDGHSISDPGRPMFWLRMRLRVLRLPLRLIVAVHGL
jgi:hypothetical protein